MAAPAPRAAATGDFRLTVENIMRGELLVGTSPSEVRWAEDSRTVWFRWRDPESGDTATALWRVAVEGGAPEPVADSVAARLAPAAQGRWSLDRARRAVERGGDIFVVEADGRERRITDTPARERLPHLSSDGRTVYFLTGSDVFAIDLAGGGPLRQLTDLRSAAEPEKKKPEGQKRFLEEQQKELFDVVRGELAQKEQRERVDSLRTRVRPTWLGRGRRVLSAEVSPSGRLVLLGVSDTTADRQTMVPNFVTESGYTEPLTVRTKVGDAQRGQRAAIVELETGKLTWIDGEPKGRARSWMPMGWAPASDRALVMAIADDFKDRWLYVAGADGRANAVDHLHDDAWVGGPAFYAAGWLPGTADGRGERVYFVSERTGYAHLYTVPAEGGRATPVTAGQWEVTDVQLAPGADRFFLTTSETHPGERHLYSVPVQGGERTRLTALEGWNEALVSPDGRHVAVLHSEPDSPPELFLAPLAPLSEARRITRSTTAEFQRGPWIRPELVQVPASDGAQVWARIYRPQDLGAEPNGAAVIFVHGAGYLQNAHKGWSTYYREYMFHHLLAARGYTVLDMDYRASSGYGRDWRTGIYRHMGGKDLSDHVDGARWLAEHEGVDPKRVGIYGGSYGGFITLMAMFTEPDVFRSGAALRSVTDWAHYNHPYTARILNQPQDDPEAYRRSSPIYFAEGLKGDLLIAHGMVDTNVHFQDVVRLAQRLIELGKTNWEMAVYPVENHAFVRADSWTDEYRRILELFERTLR
ncbi:MAG TPA: prolyl oligopeptidase family serine peptidase [Longimicrobiaceae bacterium]|nr:prolyl oligopeptidase family serine peptidase [Longimicrobiaceae bacterium]